jgi:hypothetical protein
MRHIEAMLRARAGAFGLTLFGAALIAPHVALADEGGVSFWIPGFFGSLAAAPLQPGLTVTAIDYYDSVRAGADVALSRDITIRGFNANLNVNINANLNSRINFGFVAPSYTFEQPFLGGQATAWMLVGVGQVRTTLEGTIAGNLGPFGFSHFGSITDQTTAPSDIIPIFTQRWNAGVNNFMAYIAGDLPVGAYDRTSPCLTFGKGGCALSD